MLRPTIVVLLALAAALPTGCGDTTGTRPAGTESSVVAIGWARASDGEPAVPRVLRQADGDWIEAALPESILREYELTRPGASGSVRGRFRLRNVGFDSPRSAWILASGPDDVGGALLQSDDGGTTWRDASDLLPEDVRYRPDAVVSTPLAIWFRSEVEWWVAGGERRGPLTIGPIVWHSTDGGSTWQRTVARGGLTTVHLFFSQLGERPALLFDDGTPGTCVSRLALERDARPQPLLSCPGDPLDYVERDGRGWLTVGTGSIYSWTGEPPFAEVSLPVDPGRSAFPSSIDFADVVHGITCGETAAAAAAGKARTPACWFSADGGATWQPSLIPTEPGWVGVEDVALSSRQQGWAIATFGTDPDLQPRSTFRFLRTDDAGATWHPVDTTFDDRSTMTRLATWHPPTD